MMLLGLAGAYTEGEEEASHYATKVGGQACFPGAVLPAGAQELTCQACSQQLSLVLQAYAPLNAKSHGVDAPERCLYVYGCGRPGCGKVPGAWRVVRCQLPVPSTSPADDAVQAEESSPHAGAMLQQSPAAAASNEWGDGFGDDDSFGAGQGLDASAFDFSDLNAALDNSMKATQQQPQSGLQSSKHSKAGTSTQPTNITHDTVPTVRASKLPGVPTLPEFYIAAAEEPQGVQLAMKQSEASHIQELLLRYQQAEAEEGAGGPSSHAWLQSALTHTGAARLDDDDDDEDGEGDSTVGSSAGGGGTGPRQAGEEEGSGSDGEGDDAGGGDGDGEWVQEEYEEDTLEGVHPSYLKYNKRLQREAQQCVRYCWNGPLLWPRKPMPKPGLCAHCGAPRVMELQLMAPVIAFILEAADADGGTSGCSSSSAAAPYGARVADREALIAAADWDLCTLAAFTCSRSCLPAGLPVDAQAAVLVQEHVELVNETDCHL